MRILSVTVVPDCAKPGFEAIDDNTFKVYVTQSSKKGKANKNMLKELARQLRVHESSLIVSQGDRSNTKTVILIED